MVATTQQQQQPGQRTQGQSPGGGTTSSGGPEQTRDVQGQAGNAGTEARARGGTEEPNPQEGTTGESDTANPDRRSEARPNAQRAFDLLNASPFVYPTFLTACAGLYRTSPGAVPAFITTGIVITKLHSTLSGAQTYETLETLRHPARGAGRVVTWVDHLRQATNAAPANAYSATIAGADPADLDALLLGGNDAALQAVFAGLPQDPLTLFPAQQTALSANACASVTFMTQVIGRSTADQIWRAVQGTGAGQHAAMCNAFNTIANGWNWLDGIAAASLSQPQRALLGTLHPLANPTAQGRITTINSTAGMPTPGVPFATAFTALQTAGTPPTAAALRSLLQTGTTLERAALFGDNTKATFIFGILTGEPFVELSILPGERQQYMEKDAFFLRVLNHPTMTWMARLDALCGRAYMNALAARFNANAAAVVTFITTTIPASIDQIPEEYERDIRAIALVANAPTVTTAVTTKFADRVSATNHQGAGTGATPEATQTPLQRLDAKLAVPVTAAVKAEILSMLGALGPDRTVVAADGARMTSIRTKLDDEQYFDGLIALQVSLTQALTEIRAKAIPTAVRLQTLVTRANALARNLALRSDDNVNMVKTTVVQDPIGFMLQGAALDAATFDNAAWRTWVLESTSIPTLLATIGGSTALANAFAPKLDAAGGSWALFLARAPDGAALSTDERLALDRLRLATTQPTIAGQIRAKTTAVTAPPPGLPPGFIGPPAPTPTKLQQLQTEIGAVAPNAARMLQLANEITQGERDTFATAERARLLTAFSAEQIVRFVRTITGPIATRILWVKDKGGNAPMSDVTSLLQTASEGDRAALFDSAPIITWLKAQSTLGPLQVMGLNDAHIPALVAKQQFWEWAHDRQSGFEIMRFIAVSGNIPTAITQTLAVNRWPSWQSLPSGTGMPPETRDHIDTIFPTLTNGGIARFLFGKRFGIATTGWAAVSCDDIKRLYEECRRLPPAQIANNPKLKAFNRGSGGGGDYAVGTGTANINQTDLAGTSNMYAGTPNQVAENYFDHTVRHEIGHSVDAMLGERTPLVYQTAGWKAHTIPAMDTWITAMDGWNPGGGATPTDPDKQAIRDLITQLIASGGNTIRGPNIGAPQLAPPGHAFHRYPQLKIVQSLSANAGTMVYLSPNRIVANSKVFSINYYYRQLMECTTTAGLNVPRDYCMFSPAEWFADMYAEYYRAYNGRDDGTLGGNCPGFVKTWMYSNVHLAGGRTPSDLNGRPRPRGTAVHA